MKDPKFLAVTGFNEWIALKLSTENSSISGKPFFCDTYNQEYSRDIEMMQGGYGDNYVMQLAKNIRTYKYTESKEYFREKGTITNNDKKDKNWQKASVYVDFAEDIMTRDSQGFIKTLRYVDTSNRNDIVKTFLISDDKKLYIKIETKDKITDYMDGDENWMNILISTNNADNNSFYGYDFLLNSTPISNAKTSLQKIDKEYNKTLVHMVDYVLDHNSILFSVPLAVLGNNITKIDFKVFDNVKNPNDIMNFYRSGDSAPIGRFRYHYAF